MESIAVFMESLHERRKSILATVRTKMPAEQFGIDLNDLWQDTIERILTDDRWRTYDATKGTLKTWALMQIRHVLALRTKTLAMQAAVSTMSLDDVSLTLPAGDMFDDVTLRLDVEKALEALDQDDVTMLRLYYRDGYNLAQIAAQVGLPTSTVHRRMQTATSALRKTLTA